MNPLRDVMQFATGVLKYGCNRLIKANMKFYEYI